MATPRRNSTRTAASSESLSANNGRYRALQPQNLLASQQFGTATYQWELTLASVPMETGQLLLHTAVSPHLPRGRVLELMRGSTALVWHDSHRSLCVRRYSRAYGCVEAQQHSELSHLGTKVRRSF